MDESSIDEVILSVFSFRKQQLLDCVKPNVLKDVEWKQERSSEGFASNDYKILRLEIISADCCRMSSASRTRVRVNSLAHKFLSRHSGLELSY